MDSKSQVNAQGGLKIGPAAIAAELDASALSAPRTFVLPDKSGTVALAGVSMTQQSPTEYTLVAGDAWSLVQRTNATLNKVYVDPSVFDLTGGPVFVAIQQVGAGLMSVDAAAGSGATMNKGGMTASAYQRGSLMYIIIDTSTSFYVGGEVKYL